MGILRSLGDFLTSPAEQLVDPADCGTARLLAACLLAISVVFACLDVGLVITRDGYVPPWEGYTFLTISYLISRTRHYRWGAVLTTVMFPTVASYLAIGGLRPNPGALAYAVLAPLFAGLFLGGLASGVLALLVPVCMLLIPLLSGGSIPFSQIIDPFVASTLGGLLAVAYAVRRDQIEQRARERSRLHEAQMLQMQKMEALGRMAGGIAHDFNNLLTVISGGVELLARHGQAKELKLIDSATTSAQELTAQLLTLSRQGVVDHSSTNLRSVLKGLHQLLSRIIGEDIEIRVSCSDDVHHVALGGSQLQQVLLNLATNARDAMPRGGVLEFVAKNGGDGRVLLSVADTGEGMDESTAQKVFEPFFTTKSVGKGTGLGMSMVFGLVTQAGGSITIDSKQGRGTTFHLILRRAEAVLDAPAPSERRLELKGSAKGCVLLVEDDTGVRELCRSVLRREGYRVLEAADPLEALEFFDEQGASIDLVLSDIVMPHMTGLELRDVLASKAPSLPVLFMSGYAPEDVVSQPVDSRHLLRKPFRPTELLRRVSALLYGLESQAPPAPLAGSNPGAVAPYAVPSYAPLPAVTQPSPSFAEHDAALPEHDAAFVERDAEVESGAIESQPATSRARIIESGDREMKTGKRIGMDDVPPTEISKINDGSKD